MHRPHYKMADGGRQLEENGLQGMIIDVLCRIDWPMEELLLSLLRTHLKLYQYYPGSGWFCCLRRCSCRLAAPHWEPHFPHALLDSRRKSVHCRPASDETCSGQHKHPTSVKPIEELETNLGPPGKLASTAASLHQQLWGRQRARRSS